MICAYYNIAANCSQACVVCALFWGGGVACAAIINCNCLTICPDKWLFNFSISNANIASNHTRHRIVCDAVMCSLCSLNISGY